MDSRKKSRIASKAAIVTWLRTKKGARALKKLLGKDYEIEYKGWPDLIAFNKHTGTYYFVELKRDSQYRTKVSDILSPEQNAIRKILERIGKNKSKYEIWFFEDKKGSTKITKSGFCSGEHLILFD